MVGRPFTIIIILSVHHHPLIFCVHYPALRAACYLYPDERVVNLHFMSAKELAIYCLLRGECPPISLCEILNMYQSPFCSQNIPNFFLMFWSWFFFCFVIYVYLWYNKYNDLFMVFKYFFIHISTPALNILESLKLIALCKDLFALVWYCHYYHNSGIKWFGNNFSKAIVHRCIFWFSIKTPKTEFVILTGLLVSGTEPTNAFLIIHIWPPINKWTTQSLTYSRRRMTAAFCCMCDK